MSYVFRRQPSLITARLKLCPPTSGRCLVSNLDPRLPSLGRTFTTSSRLKRDKYDGEAKKLNQKGLDEHEQEVKVQQRQIKVPWHRENVDKPPVDKDERATRAMTKGKLLTTPTRLLKLVIPMPFGVDRDKSGQPPDRAKGVSSSESIQPLALLVHPQQPLSYLERLIQAEVPPIIKDGQEKTPNIYFRAEDTPTARGEGGAKDRKTSASTSSEGKDRAAHVAPYSGLGREGPQRGRAESNWVRWSSSTEVGDFIRDAARGREFAIEVEGYGVEILVGVPSFNDRTYYMRLRLRTMARRIDGLTHIKRECDLLAHRGAYRLAKGGFALLSAWWGTVYYVTFHTEFGWDLVEPVTYLAGLMTIMGGYLWFLYISRDLSYKAALNVTVSRRQHALYETRGFDLHKWEGLLQEANSLRNEINKVALEYDVDWDDTKDVGEEVKEALDKQERKRGNGVDSDEDEDARELQEERREEERIETEKGKGDQKEEEVKSKPDS